MRVRLAPLDSVVDVTAPPEVAEPLTDLLHEISRTGSDGLDRPTAEVRVTADVDGYVVDDGSSPARARDLEEALELLLAVVNRTAVLQCRDFAAHAGVVASDGTAVAFPARSGVGKSTLVGACLQQGWAYVSDEALVVRPSTDVRPYAKPLSLHTWSLARLGLTGPPGDRSERAVPVSQLGHASTGPLRLTHLVVPRRATGAADLLPLPRAEGAMVLLEHSFNHFRDPAGSLHLVAGLVRAASTWVLVYDDPVDAAVLLRRRLG